MQNEIVPSFGTHAILETHSESTTLEFWIIRPKTIKKSSNSNKTSLAKMLLTKTQILDL